MKLIVIMYVELNLVIKNVWEIKKDLYIDILYYI